jgi:hypothetical protein
MPWRLRHQQGAQNVSSVIAASSAVQDTSRRRRASMRHSASYHPANFMERHANSAYNRNLECANCHETSRFCRDCHERRGMGTSGRLQAGFHDAQPDKDAAAGWFGIYMVEQALGIAAAADSALERARKRAPGATIIHPK